MRERARSAVDLAGERNVRPIFAVDQFGAKNPRVIFYDTREALRNIFDKSRDKSTRSGNKRLRELSFAFWRQKHANCNAARLFITPYGFNCKCHA